MHNIQGNSGFKSGTGQNVDLHPTIQKNSGTLISGALPSWRCIVELNVRLRHNGSLPENVSWPVLMT